MPSNLLRAVMVLTLSLGCAACASPSQTSPQSLTKDDFGEATHETLAAQIINPAPAYDGQKAVISSDHAVQATERYWADKVKQPVPPKTSKLAAAAAPASAN